MPLGSAAISAEDLNRERIAAALRGFGPIGLLAMLVILAGNLVLPLLSAVLVLVWARWSRTPWGEIGYVRPRSWLVALAVGVPAGVAFKLLMKAAVMPLLGAPPTNPAFHFLAGNSAALPGMLFAVIVGAGFGEETLYRGYLFERLGKLLGSGAGARAAIVLVTAALFALAHYREQGLAGTEQAAITGLAFGTVFVVTGRIVPIMIAHAAFDLAAVAIVYWNLEAAVARLIFR